MTPFQMPEVAVGDLVLWFDNPQSPIDPAMGWVVERPGRETISILVFSQTHGFVEKKSVRHKDDPFWRESEVAGNWMSWGCFDLHSSTALLKELRVLLTNAKMEAARRGPGRPKSKEEVAA